MTLGDLFKYREISLLSDRPAYHGEAYELRRKHMRLTHFDSHHAAVGITENIELVSYDKEYAKVGELEHSHPSKYIQSSAPVRTTAK